jgi:hypothetical protein
MSDHWNPDIPFALLIIVLCVAMFIPEMIEGVRTYFRGRDLARELYRESDKSRLFDQDRDDWK